MDTGFINPPTSNFSTPTNSTHTNSTHSGVSISGDVLVGVVKLYFEDRENDRRAALAALASMSAMIVQGLGELKKIAAAKELLK